MWWFIGSPSLRSGILIALKRESFPFPLTSIPFTPPILDFFIKL